MEKKDCSSVAAPLSDDKRLQPAKKVYKSPVLTEYGSVKQLTNGGTFGSVGDGQGMNMVASDPALKDNVVRIGDHPLGIGLYLFDYKPQFGDSGEGRQFGVMADEVERVMPEAVLMGADGYKQVNYAVLGVRRAGD